jgi:hypothetical protein
MKISLEDSMDLMQAIAICNYVNNPVISIGCRKEVIEIANGAFSELVEELSEAYNFDPTMMLCFDPLQQELTFDDNNDYFNSRESSINLLN